jgi:hypothetical protein
MYVWHNIEARSCNHRCSGRAISITYCEFCVCCFRYPACNMHAPYSYLWSVQPYNIFPLYLINGTIKKKKKFAEHKMCVLIFSTTFIWNISHFEKRGTWYDQKGLLFFTYSICYSCQMLMKLEFSWQILKKYSNIKFLENPSIGSRVVPCGWMDGLIDMTKLMATSQNFTNTPNNWVAFIWQYATFRTD